MSEYKLVPVEPTREMHEAGTDSAYRDDVVIRDIYNAMLAAAPEVNPWVSVDRFKPVVGLMYVVTNGTDIFGAEACTGYYLNYYHGTEYKTITHVWDESILPIPRPKE